jgi:hypothetical protein
MVEPPSKKKSDPINPNLPPRTVRYLKRLTRSGLHGKTVSTVARILIQDQIKTLIREGALKMEFAEDDDDSEEEAD